MQAIVEHLLQLQLVKFPSKVDRPLNVTPECDVQWTTLAELEVTFNEQSYLIDIIISGLINFLYILRLKHYHDGVYSSVYILTQTR